MIYKFMFTKTKVVLYLSAANKNDFYKKVQYMYGTNEVEILEVYE